MAGERRSPWKMFAPLIAVLVLAALWSAYWFIALSYAKTRVAAEREKFAQQGFSLACSSEAWAGYPFRFEFICTSPVITVAGRAEARSEYLQIFALAYAPRQAVALIDGPTTVTAPQLLPAKTAHERIVASVTFDRNWQPWFSAEIPRLSIPDVGAADKVMIHTRPAESGRTDIALSATKLSYVPPDKPAIVLDQADLLATFDPALKLNIEKVEMRQGNLQSTGSGEISLDAEHRISGRLSTETNDLNGLLTVIEPYLRLDAQQVTNLRTVLGLLGANAKLPVTAQDGKLYVGPIVVAKLLPLY